MVCLGRSLRSPSARKYDIFLFTYNSFMFTLLFLGCVQFLVIIIAFGMREIVEKLFMEEVNALAAYLRTGDCGSGRQSNVTLGFLS